MKIRTLVCQLALFASVSPAQEAGDTPPPTPAQADMAQMMADYAKLGQPGEQHRLLASLVGTWDAQQRIWTDPAASPLTVAAKARSESILGGRFVRMHYEGSMMGMPMHGESTTGFNNFKQQFEQTWISSMDTAIWVSTGTLAEDGKSIAFVGEADDPMAGKRKVRHVWHFQGPDQHVFESFDTLPDGKEFRVMEITYTRAAAAAADTAGGDTAGGDTAGGDTAGGDTAGGDVGGDVQTPAAKPQEKAPPKAKKGVRFR